MTKRFEYKKPVIVDGSWSHLTEDDIAYHPSPPTKVTLHLPYLKVTDNNITAALLIDYFHYYTSSMYSTHNIEWITLSIMDIKEDFQNAIGDKAIRTALDLLVELSVLERRKSPNDPMQGSRQYRLNLPDPMKKQ